MSPSKRLEVRDVVAAQFLYLPTDVVAAQKRCAKKNRRDGGGQISVTFGRGSKFWHNLLYLPTDVVAAQKDVPEKTVGTVVGKFL
jgi:hypothetical protein